MSAAKGKERLALFAKIKQKFPTAAERNKLSKQIGGKWSHASNANLKRVLGIGEGASRLRGSKIHKMFAPQETPEPPAPPPPKAPASLRGARIHRMFADNSNSATEILSPPKQASKFARSIQEKFGLSEEKARSVERRLKTVSQDRVNEYKHRLSAEGKSFDPAVAKVVAHNAMLVELTQLKRSASRPSTKTETAKEESPPKSSKDAKFSCTTDMETIRKAAKDWDKDIEEVKAIAKYYHAIEYGNLMRDVGGSPGRDAKKQLAEIKAKYKGSPYWDVDPGQLRDSSSIAGTLHMSVRWADDDMAAVIDKSGKLQALMSYSNEKNHLYISFLATNPRNLTNDKSAVRGSGTEAIAQAVQLSQKAGHGGRVKLTALTRAVPFYKKMGFTSKGGSMELTPEKAEELLRKLGKS